jgi:hypothetical protein
VSRGATATGFEELIDLEDRGAWEAALRGVPHAFAHTWDNCQAIRASTRYRTFLYCFDSPGARVVCPLAERPVASDVDVVTPYGLSGFVGAGDCPSLAAQWWAFAKCRRYVCAYLLLNPVLSNDTYFREQATHHKVLFVMDLRQSEEQLFMRLSTNRRRQVRRADERSLVTDPARLADFFVATYPGFMARRGAATAFRLNERSLRALCDSPRTLLVGAQDGGCLRAVSLFGFTDYAGDFLFNASLPGEESSSAALIWAAALELKALGVPTLNLGGGVSEGDSLAEFKRRFGAEQAPLRHIKQVYRPARYSELCQRVGADPAAPGYFPAYRRGEP